MKKRVALPLVLALLALVSLVLPEAARALGGYCSCGPAAHTPTISAWANGCPTATDNLEAALWGYVSCYLCRDPVLTSSCHYTGGEDPFAIATGYFTYRCYQLGGGCQIP